MADYLNIAGRVRTTASDGVAMEAQEVKDLNQNKSQQEINADVQTELADRYTKSETYSKEQLDDLITTPDVNYVSVVATDATTAVTDVLPATGEADTIYRVGNWNGTQYDSAMYALFAWNGTTYVCLAVRSFVGEVYDISANHPDGQGNPTPYADLAAALGTDGANIPADIRRGGMSIKFIHTSDNKYVQFMYMGTAVTGTPNPFLDTANWQGVDKEPTENSANLVTSGGVYKFRDSYKSRTTSNTVAAGVRLELANSFIRMNTVLSADVKFNGNFESVELGRGNSANNLLYSFWAVINSTTITVYGVLSGTTSSVVKTFTHGLTIAEFVNISIVSKITDAYIVVTTKSGSYESSRFTWYAGGIPYVKNLGTNSITATLSYAVKREDVMLVHDSYGLYWQNSKWPYYLIEKGINVFATDGQTGYTTGVMEAIINNDLYFYRPKYLIYELGMNNTADTDATTPDATWLSYAKAIKRVCTRKGIELIFCTIPSVPNKLNDGKNYWIRNTSECRYIDIADAVGAQSNGTWYSGMLATDNIHPTALGAKVMSARVLSDFPEIADKQNTPIDKTPTKNSTNNAESGGIYDRINQRGCIVLAAYDSTAEAKASADLVAADGFAGIALINTAIGLLSSKGGRIFLRNGTYQSNSIGVNVTVNNITIEGESLGVIISRTGGGTSIFTQSAIDFLLIKTITIPSGAGVFSFYAGTKYAVLDVKVSDIYYAKYANTVNYRFVPVSAGIEGISNAIYNSADGALIELEQGTYTNISGSSGISFYNGGSIKRKNILIIGKGQKTIISRANGNADIYINVADCTGNIVRDVAFAHSVSNPYGKSHLRLQSCWVNGVYTSQTDNVESADGSRDIHCGEGCEYSTLSSAYASISDYAENKRWNIHIHGYVKETAALIINKPYVNLIGHNAKIEFAGAKAVCPTFSDANGALNILVKDIHFIKTGCYNYWDAAAVEVNTDYAEFHNCIFENNSSSPSAFTPSSGNAGQSDTNGSRRHGCRITVTKFGKECKLYFYNCKGIGSPYAFQNTRGWYIMFGSPKLYNCVGIGGGIGDMGHGFISHRSAQAEFYNCLGYGSPMSWQDACGFRFQAGGTSKMFNCIGRGGCGVKWQSLGVSAERLAEVTIGGVIDYSQLTNEDVQLVEMGEGSNKCAGISLWNCGGSPEMYDCIGYCGSGTNSAGLQMTGCRNDCKPIVKGGFFGLEKQELFQVWRYDTGESYMTFKIDEERLNQYSGYVIEGVTVSINTTFSSSARLYVVTDEGTPKVIVDGYQLQDVSSIGIPTITRTAVDANVGLKAYILDSNGDNITTLAAQSLYLHVLWSYNQGNLWGLDFNCGNPRITGATICAKLGMEASSPGTNWWIKGCTIEGLGGTAIIGAGATKPWRIYDCLIKGTYPNDINIAGRTMIGESSNYTV